MTIDDMNNPDGHGSYGKSPSKFAARPKDKTTIRSNDATAGPMGHAAEEQEVFDEDQRKKARPQNTAGDPFISKPIPKPNLPDPLSGKNVP
jgi:hypothetical protein